MDRYRPLPRAAEHPRIVNMSSGIGSFQRILDPGTAENAVTSPVYPAAKAALTMPTEQLRANAGRHPGERGRPRLHRADFNNYRGTQTVTEGTDAIAGLATLAPDGPAGTFQDRHSPVPW